MLGILRSGPGLGVVCEFVFGCCAVLGCVWLWIVLLSCRFWVVGSVYFWLFCWACSLWYFVCFSWSGGLGDFRIFGFLVCGLRVVLGVRVNVFCELFLFLVVGDLWAGCLVRFGCFWLLWAGVRHKFLMVDSVILGGLLVA